MLESPLLQLVVFFLVFVGLSLKLTRSYRRCPADKILVISSKRRPSQPGGSSFKCIHGGGAFILPVFQSYAFLDLTPITIDLRVEDFPLLEKLRVASHSTFVVAISTDPGIMERAAERLLGLTPEQINDLARGIVEDALHRGLASLTADDIRARWDTLGNSLTLGVGTELEKLGLHLVQPTLRDRLYELGESGPGGEDVPPLPEHSESKEGSGG